MYWSLACRLALFHGVSCSVAPHQVSTTGAVRGLKCQAVTNCTPYITLTKKGRHVGANSLIRKKKEKEVCSFWIASLKKINKSACSVCRNWPQLGGHVTLLESKTNNYSQIKGIRSGRCSWEQHKNRPTWWQQHARRYLYKLHTVLPVIPKYLDTNRNQIQPSQIKRQTAPPWKPR